MNLQILSFCSLHQTFVLGVSNYEVKMGAINILLCGSLPNFVGIAFQTWEVQKFKVETFD